jgi:hypothetical protein
MGINLSSVNQVGGESWETFRVVSNTHMYLELEKKLCTRMLHLCKI